MINKKLLPEFIELETSTFCNRRCPWCPNSIYKRGSKQKYINLYAKPNSPVLGKRLQKRFGQFKQAIESLNSEQINAFEQQQQMELDGEILNSDDILIFREAKAILESLAIALFRSYLTPN